MQIHIYAEQGNIAKVQQEITDGVDINSPDEYESRTPLMFAVSSPHANIDMVRLLVENGADVNALDTYKRTVLGLTVQSGNLEKIKFLLDAGADINYQTPNGYDVLIDAMYGRDITKNENLLAIIDLLIKRGAKLTGVSDYGESALIRASRTGRFDAVKILLAAGADPQQLQWTELIYAIVFGSLADVERLIAQGANLSAIDVYGRTPWLFSLQVGDLAKAKLLLPSASNDYEQTNCGRTPLMYAIENNRGEILKWLIEEGFDIEATDQFGTTLLMVAVECDHPECVKILLEAGAKTDIKNSCDEKVIQQTNNIEIARMLLAVGEDINDVNDDMLRLLMGVCKNDIRHISKSQYLAGKHRRFGTKNPELMEVDFWKAMVSTGFSGYQAQCTFKDTNDHQSQPVWCFDRFGKTVTQLPDGKIVVIAGEHEDFYDPDFCIYNDVIVAQGDGDFQIYGYSEDVFPPTDFHSATLVGEYIYIIGCLGYLDQRICDYTPVYRLHCETFAIERVETSGENPGWIHKHTACYEEPNKICISGGEILAIVNQKQQLLANANSYTLDLKNFRWTRVILSDGA
ncbi:ankyrin repeat domain-containing protein [Nodularia sphaerocarpa]|uniref:ankyrin repeat domain-containing protein n=2 Tax=Nodularia sphaerocarpa TaxID=137816 RepID=UPI001EFB5D09|nr:ankyrin repeat domain-containing protein [Nodularia sphaerocarpa]MDB9372166.1 ankyrin repeat domain-containing protein [Nodularia sphaerocarpa CS-585]ULP73191.1 hypothetical protein BDGGKGIB_02844 [Nodularia sphaerocarpa UHCC 0038]